MTKSDEDGQEWVKTKIILQLRLYVAGGMSVSARAIRNLKDILDRHVKGKYQLEVIDIYQQPEIAKTENLTAVPLLVKLKPLPKRLMIGDMSNEQRLLKGLGLI